ncbi:hypothetical protein [Streptomyces sp. S.PNR 29]|uniref:hypothetical protein n=1 Tax=Streptomyces sp. S.PNR 29 TaxID=2973805 RepID=UPI0025B27990|nr:hypothetical protein [Streptomyces sp. S.PNR 29]MDN0194158.1 hypothetical protein [Streptomyces sp. S.PNR 29]
MTSTTADEITPRPAPFWTAPVIATVLLAVLWPAALFFGGLSAMATDACGPDDCSSGLMTSLSVIYGTLSYGGLFSAAAYVAAWALPRERRWSALRSWTAIAALLPPGLVLLLVFTLPAP